MKFKEFKDRYKIATRNSVAVAGDDEFKLLLAETAADIHRAVTPLEKMEIDDRNFKVDYYVDNKYFVRKFQAPENDESEIDFLDEMLLRALVYGVAVKRCIDEKNEYKYTKEYNKAITEYELNNFDERSYDLEHALVARGWIKPYELNAAIDEYIWDETFLSKLDFWLANVPTLKNISYRKFIYRFIDFQNGKISDRKDLIALDKVMKARIRP